MYPNISRNISNANAIINKSRTLNHLFQSVPLSGSSAESLRELQGPDKAASDGKNRVRIPRYKD